MLANIYRVATDIYLANDAETIDTAGIQEQPLWRDVAVPLAQGVGAVLVLVGIFKIVSQVMGGKAQGAFKIGALTILGGAILFNLSLVFDLIGIGTTIVSSLIDSIAGLLS